MPSTTRLQMKIGDFLLRRLKEAGVRHLFGVPGDYNLELLQQLHDFSALTMSDAGFPLLELSSSAESEHAGST